MSLPDGIRHWTTKHPNHGMVVSSYALVDEGVLLNPLLGDDRSVLDGIDVQAVVLTNRHHRRSAEDFDAPVYAPQVGLHDLEGFDGDLHGYADGDELPGGLRAVEVGGISEDEFAVHVPQYRAVCIADNVMREGEGELATPPDSLLGDPPDEVRRAIGAALLALCEAVDFDHLLLPHGDPIADTGRETLETVAAGLVATDPRGDA